MSKCLNCKKDLVQTIGKREKIFCNSTCRSNYWQKTQTLERQGKSLDEVIKIMTTKPETVKIATPVLDKFIDRRFKNIVPPKDETNITDEIAQKIIAIKTRPKPSFISKKAWEADQQKQISALTNNPI